MQNSAAMARTEQKGDLSTTTVWKPDTSSNYAIKLSLICFGALVRTAEELVYLMLKM